MSVVGVKFRNNNGIVYIDSDIIVELNDYVICSYDKGLRYGKVVSLSESFEVDELYSILRIANNEDYNVYLDNLKKEKEAVSYIKELINKLKINMNVVSCDYNFDKSLMLFYFTSDERIDFRELVKLVAGKYKTRIELRQIGIRDKAKMVSGIGVCGRTLCCHDFLNKISTVTINMAKNQNISLNPNKINGACGRLLCCLNYEDCVYTENRKKLPKIGSEVEYNGKKYKVLSIDVLRRSYTIDYNDEVKEIVINEE